METLWNVNDIFSMTFYTYDKIREVGWKNWDFAVSLYIRYLEQARLQWTDSTYSKDVFMMKAMWRNKTKFYDVKPILQNLWLIEQKEKRDENWKIINHYVQVNFIIKGETTTVLKTQTLVQPDSGNLDTNTICTKYKCLYTKNKYLSENSDEWKSTTSSKKKELTAEQTEAFERVWKEYPQKTHKKDARKHFLECDYDELMFDAKQKKRMVELEVIEKQYVKWWWRWMEEFSPQSDSQKLQDMRKIFEKHMEIWWEDMRERMERMKDDFPDVDFKKLASDYNEKNKIKFNFTP